MPEQTTQDPDGLKFGMLTDDHLAELVHDAMCSGRPYRDRCRLAALSVKANLEWVAANASPETIDIGRSDEQGG